MSVRLILGPVETVLPTLDAASFDAVLCDPPYGLSFMGKAWDHGVPGEPIWRDVLRCVKPGAPLLAFGGTRTFHRLMCAIEDAGFDIRDVLCWLYGSGFPKSLDVSKAIDEKLGVKRPRVSGGAGGRAVVGPTGLVPGEAISGEAISGEATQWSGYGTALKPAWEPCVLAMAPLDGTFAANALKHGVAGLNVDGGRIAAEGGSPAAERRANSPVPSPRADASMQNRVTAERYAKVRLGESLGRWPANVLLDGEAARALDEQSGRSSSSSGVVLTSQPGRVYGMGKGMPSHTGLYGFDDEGGASRFFYTAKADAAERMGSKHPTLKPIDLCAYLAKLILPPKRKTARRLLVPFSGAGSEIIGALRAGWDEVVGIEREAEYVADAKRRIEADAGLLHAVTVAP